MNPSYAKRRNIRIVGAGDSGCVREDPRSIPEMALCAVERALDDAGIGYDAVDAAVTASIDLFDGLTASNIAVTEAVGAVMRPESRIAADGLAATIHACCQLWAEAYRTVLVVAHGKASMSRHDELTNWAMDPVALQPLGINFLMCSALQAETLRRTDAGAGRRWAEIAALNRGRAGDAGIAGPCTTEDVLNSEFIASPLRADMRAPLGDAAYALVLQRRTDEEPGIAITGVGHDLAAHGLWDDDWMHWAGLRRASDRALSVAGLTASDIDLYEPSCHFAHEEELFIRACGAAEGTTLSSTGGLFAGVAPATGGISRLIAATRAMRKDPGVKRAFAHGSWGPAGQAHAVAILEAVA